MATCAQANCRAGANEDEDEPMQRPKRTRKRRPEEIETRPARRQHAKEELPTPIDPPFLSSAETPAPVKEEKDVDMEPAAGSQASTGTVTPSSDLPQICTIIAITNIPCT